jgi:hypothetical protein
MFDILSNNPLSIIMANNERITPILSMSFLVDSFIGKKSNFDAREFAAVENQIKDKEKRLKMFAADPEQYAKYIEAYPLDLAIVDTYNKQVNGTLNKVRAQLNVIRRSPDYSPKERKELIEDLTSVQNLIKRGMIDTFEAYDIKH